MVITNSHTILMLVAICMLFGITAIPQSWSLGPGVLYGDDIQQVGIHVRGYYNLPGDRICFGPEFSHFFSKSEHRDGEEISKYLNEINFNLHYIFELNDKWGIYPVTGVNLSFEREEVRLQNGGVQNNRDSAVGVNLGIGLHRAVNNWLIFGEFDHLFSDLSQKSFVMGAFYTFGKGKEAPPEE